MNAERITNYYIPASGSRIHYLEYDNLKDQEEETYELNINEDSEKDSIIGLYDAALQNNKYIDLLDKFGIASLNNDELKELVGFSEDNESEPWDLFDTHQAPLDEIQKQAILEHFYLRRTKDEILGHIKINKDSLNLAIRSFSRCLKIRQKCNKSLLKKKTKLKDSHLEFIESLIWT